MKETRVAVEGVLMAGHKSPAVEVLFDPATELRVHEAALWPGRRGVPVEVLLNGIRFRSAIVSRMRRYFVLVDESLARRAGARVGTRVKLTVWADGASSPASATVRQAKAGAAVSASGSSKVHRRARANGVPRKRRRATRR